MKDNKMKLLEVLEVTETTCKLRFDERIINDSLLRGMYPDMVNYKSLLVEEYANIFTFEIIKLNPDFYVMKDLQVGNIFDYEDVTYIANPTLEDLINIANDSAIGKVNSVNE